MTLPWGSGPVVDRLAQALYRLATGDHYDAPRPWAYLSGLGITNVSDVRDGAFDVAIDGQQYRISVRKMEPELEPQPGTLEFDVKYP